MGSKIPYDPHLPSSRRHLAARVVQMCLNAGFFEEAPGGKTRERVFYRHVDGVPSVRVQVWTSVEGDGDAAETREVGEDAVRVCAVYRTRAGKDRGIISATRVHRVGTVDDICDRLLTRMREVYGRARRPTCCSRCGAPTFRSKKKNDVCCELCFTTDREEPSHP